MADEERKTDADEVEQQEAGDAAEEIPDDSNNQTKDSDAEEATFSSQIKEEDNQDAENIVEQNVEKDKNDSLVQETDVPEATGDEGDTSQEAVKDEPPSPDDKAEENKQEKELQFEDEDDNSDERSMPINDAIPEEEEGPVVEISHSASRDPTPRGMEDESRSQREIPDAYSTPPPPQKDEEDDDDDDDREFQEFQDALRDRAEHGYSPEYPIYDRAQLLERYKEALEERSQLNNANNQLQHKLAEYFKKKKTDERVQEIEKNVTDQEQRYLKYISNLEELQNEEKRQEGEIRSQIEDLKLKCQERQEKVDRASNEYMKFKYDIAKSSINSRSGKALPLKDIEVFQAAEAKKEQEVIQVRLENIKLKNRLRKKEQQLKAKEELAEGLHLIDFEQLKIENQTYNEKIEERNEEILKLRKKITTTVQVLTHLKEKLQFVQGENGEQRGALKQIDSTVAFKRDILTRTKQVRDALRIDNTKLKQKCGLLGNEALLRDFELRKDESDELGDKLNGLRTEHVGLSINLNGVKKKIRQTRNNSA